MQQPVPIGLIPRPKSRDLVFVHYDTRERCSSTAKRRERISKSMKLQFLSLCAVCEPRRDMSLQI